MQAVADHPLSFSKRLQITTYGYGMLIMVCPGSNNDINVLKSSNLFSKLAQGISPPANYIIQGNKYNMGYYLDDGIYLKWLTLV